MAHSKVNLVEKIAVKYCDFGTLLLEDDCGDQVGVLEQEFRGKPLAITRQILILWLQGKGRQPTSWATLVAVLLDIGLRKLATDIATHLHLFMQ